MGPVEEELVRIGRRKGPLLFSAADLGETKPRREHITRGPSPSASSAVERRSMPESHQIFTYLPELQHETCLISLPEREASAIFYHVA